VVRNLKQILKSLTWKNVSQLLVAVGIAIMPMVAVVPQMGQAQLINEVVDDCPEETGIRCEESSLADIFVLVINWALGIAFIIAVIMLIYGGFRYILSAGNEEGAKTGRTAIFNALIGIVIIVLSYIVVQIVYRFISGNSGGGGGLFGN
jgi:ABC-type transport system involved in Fe-S cluster assembly fused permease/ATPase subunit